MTTDPLDELLNTSAPDRRRIDVADTRAMIAASRSEGRPPRRGRRNALVGGALALLLVGGAGIATASGDWVWGSGLDNPDRVYAYTSPTWGQCELRFSALDTGNPFTNARVNQIVDEWFANTDIQADVERLVPRYLAVFESADAADPAAADDPRRADVNAWMAREQAVAELLHEELAAQGFDTPALAGTGSHSQVHCDSEDWGGR
ncbi:MAG: hypothetical protein P0Y60_09835 [Candidatus Microbacterium colombiense]|nr:MAG: hypothetical protein P0Y60_09835 [Microbacterium sp.]